MSLPANVVFFVIILIGLVIAIGSGMLVSSLDSPTGQQIAVAVPVPVVPLTEKFIAVGDPVFGKTFPQISVGKAYIYSGSTGRFVRSHTGTTLGEAVGSSVAVVGDINKDGMDDILVGAYGPLTRGYVFLMSGVDGSRLFSWAQSCRCLFGYAVAWAGDVNNDGFDDVAIGEPDLDLLNPGKTGPGKVFLYSGKDGSLIRSFRGENNLDAFGASVANAGDVNKDGHDDLVVGAPDWVKGGRTANVAFGKVYVYSGKDGSLIYNWTGSQLVSGFYDAFGASVAGASDINNDGYPDILVGNPRYKNQSSNSSDVGEVVVYSGKDGSVLQYWTGTAKDEEFGTSVSSVGDVDKDFHDDVLIGAPFSTGIGKAHIYSGKDGRLIRSFSINRNNFGEPVSGVGDVNENGFPDIAITRRTSTTGDVYVYDTGSGALLYSWSQEPQGSTFGSSISGKWW